MSAITKYEGCWVLNANCRDGRLEWIKNLELRENDVFIAGFPKSGITWAIEMTYLLMHDVDISKSQRENQDKRVPYLEYPDPQTVTNVVNLDSPRLLKSHLPYDLLPSQLKEKKNKIIYIFRNGKDVSVSMFHFVRFMRVFSFDGSFEEFLQDFITGDVLYGPWWEHIKSFWSRRKEANILFLTYEDLQTNQDAEITRIASFLNKEITKDQLQRIKEYCAFDRMKDNDKTNFSHLVKQNKMTSDRKNHGLIRKGVVGDWKNYYSEEMREKMDRLVKEKLQPLGLQFDDDGEKWQFAI